MYHYKARAYSPTLGRFLQTDPVGYEDGLNLYAYVASDPINKTDPSGLKCVQNGDKKGYTCTIENPGKLKGKALDRANRAYTRAVNRLMNKPGRQMKVIIGDGRGGATSGGTTQGEVAGVLINAEVTYAGASPPGTSWNASYASETKSLALYSGGLNQNERGLGITFIHEGMHGTKMDAQFQKWFRDDRRWYEFTRNPFSVFNSAHQVTESPPGEGYRGAATDAFDNWMNP